MLFSCAMEKEEKKKSLMGQHFKGKLVENRVSMRAEGISKGLRAQL